MIQPTSYPQRSASSALGLALANWLIPGAGFWIVGDRPRAITLFVVINACFAIGVLLGGHILAPVWAPRDPEFNLVAILTYSAQAFHGAGWIGLQLLQRSAAAYPESFFNMRRLAGLTFADLGVFHLVVAGSLNYFATTRLYDLLRGMARLQPGVAPEPTEPTPAPEVQQ
jgi:hypothetical protein